MVTEASLSTRIMREDGEITPRSARISYFPLVVKSGSGSKLEDVDGKQYIDFLASAAVLNTGHAHPKVVQAIVEQAQELIHYTSGYASHEHQVKLAQELARITPGDFKKRVAFGLSGSDANDGMIKVARAYTGRSKIVSFIQAYHGSTYGSISLSALSLNMRRKIGPLLPDIYHIPYPDCYRCPLGHCQESCSMECLGQLKMAFEHYLPPEEVAAVFMEPIAGDAGIVVPPKKYVQELYNLCQKHGILFVSEEVQQGFGRTGKWFGIEHFDVVPDAIVMAKAIASGMPLSAIVAREEIANFLEAPAHLFTMGGNPISCRAALATIDVIEEEQLVERSAELGQYVRERFEKLQEKYPIIGDVRGLGLSIGVDLVADPVTKERAKDAAAKICYRCWQKGLVLIFLAGCVLRVQPPLVISKEELDQGIAIIEETIKEYLNGEIPDDVLQVVKGW